MAQRLRSGGYGYGDAKKELLAAIDAAFGEARERRAQLQQDMDYVEDVLVTAGARARAVASQVVGAAREAVGMASGSQASRPS